MGELYEVPLRASGKREVIIKAVVVEAIHNGPSARFLANIATRFLQSKNAKPWDVEQAGGVIDVCLGMDYPFLQPRHLEEKFRGGQLHLYTLVFGGGLILRRVELPEALGVVDKPPVQAASLLEIPEDVEAMDKLPEDVEAMDELPEDVEAVDELPEDVEAVDELPKDVEALDKLPEDVEAPVDLPEDVRPCTSFPRMWRLWTNFLRTWRPWRTSPRTWRPQTSFPRTVWVTPPAKWRRLRG
jgi:hypothetical protein